MNWSHLRAAGPFLAIAMVSVSNPGSASAQSEPARYEGAPVSIGDGTARTVVRTDAKGTPTAIGIEFTPGMLEGLPKAAHGAQSDIPYLLPMPTTGPRTVIDHVVINWEAEGHPPPKVYDVPHFDFHFYFVSEADQKSVAFDSPNDSGDASQQPAAQLLPVNYVVPPGTAHSQMGVHAINRTAPELNGQPFTATFIYGYYNKQQTFIEPMATLAFLKSKPSFSAQVPRPAAYTRTGLYPSTYSVKYDASRKIYEVGLEDLAPGGPLTQ